MHLWRNGEDYKKKLSAVRKAISYSYLREVKVTTENSNDFARSFFYIDIMVLNQSAFADELSKNVQRVLPSYIEDKMAVPSGYVGTNCLLVTRLNDIENLNPGLMRNQVVKFGLLFAVLALGVTCLVIVLKENTNKKLRDYDELSRTLQLPVLGVIPTLDMSTTSQNVNNSLKGGKIDE